MDTRIEELAQIILERAHTTAEQLMDNSERNEKYHSYRTVEQLATRILRVVADYRKEHPKEYEDPAKCLHEQIVNLRHELKNYREREKTMGWNQD